MRESRISAEIAEIRMQIASECLDGSVIQLSPFEINYFRFACICFKFGGQRMKEQANLL